MENLFDILEREHALDPERPIVIIGHIQPDGDCVGSSLGLHNLLKFNYGWDSTVVNQKIDKLNFLGEWTLPGNVEYGHTLVVQVDNSVSNRSADPDFMKADTVIKVDHHIVMESYGKYNIEKQISSCCEIIAEEAIAHGLKFNEDAARCLYTGMVTDTGKFQYPGVNASTMRTAAVLLEAGFDMPDLISHLNSRTMEDVKFIAEAYNLVQQTEKGVLWSYVKQEVIDRYNLTPGQVSGALQTLRDVEGHPVHVLFADLGDKIRVEFRSDRVKLNQVATMFGGGGHAFAAGCRLDDASEIPAVLRELDKLI